MMLRACLYNISITFQLAYTVKRYTCMVMVRGRDLAAHSCFEIELLSVECNFTMDDMIRTVCGKLRVPDIC